MNTRKENKYEQWLNDMTYMSIIMSMLSNIIIPENLPEEIEDDFDYWLQVTLLSGSGFIVKSGDKFHLVHGVRVEPWDDFGFGENYICHTRMGKEYKGKLNDTGCVVYPYSSRRPINVMKKTADHLAELDMSEKFLIKWAKVAPFILAKDSKTKVALQEIIASVMDGNMTPAVATNAITELTDGEAVVTLDVMTPERIRDLQYLNEHREHIIKEIFELFGMPYTISTKMAQQSVDEINGTNGCCYVLAYDIQKNFNKFADKLNKTFELDVKFKLNPLILHELEKYFNESEEDRNVGENITDELTGSDTDNGSESSGDGDNPEREDKSDSDTGEDGSDK